MKSLNQSKVLNIVETLVVEVAKNLGPNFTLKEKNVRTIIDIQKNVLTKKLRDYSLLLSQKWHTLRSLTGQSCVCVCKCVKGGEAWKGFIGSNYSR